MTLYLDRLFGAKILDAGGAVFNVKHPSFGAVGDGVTDDPAAPATNAGRLYFKDNGSGKTQLVARFPTGAVQVVATEP